MLFSFFPEVSNVKWFSGVWQREFDDYLAQVLVSGWDRALRLKK
jgi:hypothetical protein